MTMIDGRPDCHAVWWCEGTWHSSDSAAFYIGLLASDGKFYIGGAMFGEPFEPGYVLVRDRVLVAPDWCRMAFAAGGPVEPILDHLVEIHGDARPWLAAAVDRLFAGPPQ